MDNKKQNPNPPLKTPVKQQGNPVDLNDIRFRTPAPPPPKKNSSDE